MSAKFLTQAVNGQMGVVFNEWQYKFIDLSGKQLVLIEISIHHWRNQRIVKEKFYYNTIAQIEFT